jgi:hypothetical protein
MSLKFSNTPQLNYGGSNRHSNNWAARLPVGARDMRTAPQDRAVVVY